MKLLMAGLLAATLALPVSHLTTVPLAAQATTTDKTSTDAKDQAKKAGHEAKKAGKHAGRSAKHAAKATKKAAKRAVTGTTGKAAPTARCQDGTISYASRAHACAGHGGVAAWMK